jgi:hypothetical protein
MKCKAVFAARGMKQWCRALILDTVATDQIIIIAGLKAGAIA